MWILNKTEFKKTGKHCKYFCLLHKNLMSKQRILLNNLPLLVQPPPFVEKIFHSHSYCQIRGSQSPPSFVKGEVQTMKKNPTPLFLTDNINLDGIYEAKLNEKYMPVLQGGYFKF